LLERERTRRDDEETGPLQATPPQATPVISAVPAKALRCPYCHGELGRDMLAARCETCLTAHHATCFAERGSCSVHGCRGRAAHVGAVAAGSERQHFGVCRACQTTIFMDERAALCRKCDSAHHPACLEGRGSCARCGSRDATLMSAAEFARASAEVKRVHARSSLPAMITGAVLLAGAVVAALFRSNEICVLLGVCAIAEFILGTVVILRSTGIAKLVIPEPPGPDARGSVARFSDERPPE
jgi:hypothetical protein